MFSYLLINLFNINAKNRRMQHFSWLVWSVSSVAATAFVTSAKLVTGIGDLFCSETDFPA